MREGLNVNEDFYIESDFEFAGAATFEVKVGVKVNWPLPAFIEIPVTLNI